MNIIQIILKNIEEGWSKFKIIEKDLSNKTILITGGSEGIGLETAIQLAKMNAKIIIASRNKEKCAKAVEAIKKASGNDKIEYRLLDLGSIQGVKDFAENFKNDFSSIDILINNAGVNFANYSETQDGLEKTFHVNHLGPFILTNLLLPLIYKGNEARIINLSSKAHAFHQLQLPEDIKVKKEDYNRMIAYSKSKLMNVLFTKELARRLESRDIKVVALHPGFVKTNIGQGDSNFFVWALTKAILLFVHNLLARNVDEGAKTTVFTAIDDSIVSGEYYDSCKIGEAQPQSYDTELAKKLWELSAELAGISSEIPSN